MAGCGCAHEICSGLAAAEPRDLRSTLVWRVERDPARFAALMRYAHKIGPIANATKVAEVMAPITDREDQENAWMMLLDTHGFLRGIDPFARGASDGVSVPIPQAIRLASAAAARYVVLVHNHPSGDPTPSEDDVALTATMSDATASAGMLLLDHVIMGSGVFYSFREGTRWTQTLPTP